MSQNLSGFLVKSAHTDLDNGTVTLKMPDVGYAIAKTIELEINNLKANKQFPADITYSYNDGTIQINIASDSVANIAINAVKIMTRRATSFLDGHLDNFLYASEEDTKATLNVLAAIADKRGEHHTKNQIEALVKTSQQIFEL
jgi:hypothetical protein